MENIIQFTVKFKLSLLSQYAGATGKQSIVMTF